MEIIPIEYSRQRAPRKPTLDNAAFDLDSNLMLPVLRMEMRRRVVTVVHPDNDSEEAADFRHDALYGFAKRLLGSVEFLLQFHDEFNGVKRIGTKIVDE